MTTVTLTKKITKGDELIVVPKRAYEEMERVYRRIKAKTSDEIWQEMEAEADADIKAGRVSKPIRTKRELKKYLAGLRRP